MSGHVYGMPVEIAPSVASSTAVESRPKCPECGSEQVAYGPTTEQVTCMNPNCRKVGYTFWPGGKEMPPPQMQAGSHCPVCGKPR